MEDKRSKPAYSFPVNITPSEAEKLRNFQQGRVYMVDDNNRFFELVHAIHKTAQGFNKAADAMEAITSQIVTIRFSPEWMAMNTRTYRRMKRKTLKRKYRTERCQQRPYFFFKKHKP